jgi:cytochrome P450
MTTEHPSAQPEVFMVDGFAEAVAVLSDRRLSNDPAHGADAEPDTTALPQMSQRRGISMQECDAPQHNRLRRIVAAALSQRSCARHLDQMQRRAEDRFDALLARGSGDLIADFILPVVFEVICDLLGVPEADRAAVHVWSDDSTLTDPEVSKAGGVALDEYVVSLLAAKEARPDEDLCSTLAVARSEGRLNDAEAIGTASLMVIAGYETMVSFLSCGALTFLTDPELRLRLSETPELMPTALEELFRHITPTHSTTRFATTDIAIDDAVIPTGSHVIIDFASANRDPLRFADPDRFDPSREDNKHLAFGYGAHMCPGAGLARQQSLIVFGIMLSRLGLLTLTTPAAELTWHENRFSRRPASLPVSVAGDLT